MPDTQYNNTPWPSQDSDHSFYQQPEYQRAEYQPPQYQRAEYQQQQAGPLPYTPPAYQPLPAQNNDHATVALIMGILSIAFPGPIGLPLGIVGLVFAKKARQSFVQSSLLTAGRVCSIIGIVISACILAFFVLYILFIVFIVFSDAFLH
jgi:hypothetical protein